MGETRVRIPPRSPPSETPDATMGYLPVPPHPANVLMWEGQRAQGLGSQGKRKEPEGTEEVLGFL